MTVSECCDKGSILEFKSYLSREECKDPLTYPVNTHGPDQRLKSSYDTRGGTFYTSHESRPLPFTGSTTKRRENLRNN